MAEDRGPNVLWREFEDPKAEAVMLHEGDGFAEGGVISYLEPSKSMVGSWLTRRTPLGFVVKPSRSRSKAARNP